MNERTDVGGEDLGGVPKPGDIVSAAWRIDERLGAGGMATVLAATGVDGQRAALKVMHASLVLQPGAIPRFLREGVIARRIEHPGMVRCLGEGTTDGGCPYIALELLDGCTVDELWRVPNHRPAMASLLRFFVEVLDLLAACHAMGIVHRDLKPGNIYVTREGQAKVLDFGVARAADLTDDFVREGTAMGTPSFMAPEQAMGAWRHVDERADVFSIGATLFALLSGRRLNHGRNEAESFGLAATTPAPLLASVAPSVPSDIAGFVDHALQWDKRARFADAGEMKATLQQIVLGFDADGSRLRPPVSRSLLPPALPSLTDTERGCREAFDALHEAYRARRDGQPSDAIVAAAARQLLRAAQGEVGGLIITVMPWCLRIRGRTIWTPTAPFARVLERMFADGIRSIEALPSCSERAMSGLLGVLLDRAEHDREGVSDAACELWLLRPLGLRAGVAAGMLGASAATADAAADGRRTVQRLLDAAGGVCERVPTAASARESAAFVLDDLALRQIQAAAVPAVADDRFAACLAEALEESLVSMPSEAETLGATVVDDLLRANRVDLILSVFGYILRGPDDRALTKLCGTDRLPEVLRAVDGCAEEGMVERVREILAVFGHEGAAKAVEALPSLRTAELAEIVAEHIESSLPQNAEVVGAALRTLSGATGYRLVRAMHERSPQVAAAYLEALARTEGSALGVAARALLSGPEAATPAVLDQLRSSGWPARHVALLTAAHHGMASVCEALSRRLDSPDIHATSRQERQETLRTLYVLDASAGEQAAMKLVGRHGILRDESINDTRMIAAKVLGGSSASAQAIGALRAAESPMWWNPPQVREAARAARLSIEARLRDAETHP